VAIDNDENLARLERERFDVAVVDVLYFSKCVTLIPHRLRIPHITYSVSVDPLDVRVPWLPSFVPSLVFPLSEQMGFVERVRNTLGCLVFSFILPLAVAPLTPEVREKFGRYGSFRSLDELVSKSAMWFLTIDHIVDYPHPMMPNMVDIAGVTVKRSTDKLPPGIENFIDGAANGVVLMTFGTVSANLPRHVVEKFSSAFGRLAGYRVLWRLNNSDGVKLPDNVWIAQWLPQSDILAHRSVKLFITHCGNNGQYEAVYHAVPMIGFPVLGDQFHNAARLDYKGYGLSMNLLDFTADQLLDNIRKILADASYAQRVEKASAVLRSQAQSPVERATFWIEHVCRFGGDHLRSAGNDLPLYAYLMLDVIAFITTLLLLVVCLLCRLITFSANNCCLRRRATSNDSRKKNE